jgi:hypothetical protein
MYLDDFIKHFPLCDRYKFPGARITRRGRVHCRRQQLVKLFARYRIVSELSYTLSFFNQRIHIYHLIIKYQFREKKTSFLAAGNAMALLR